MYACQVPTQAARVSRSFRDRYPNYFCCMDNTAVRRAFQRQYEVLYLNYRKILRNEVCVITFCALSASRLLVSLCFEELPMMSNKAIEQALATLLPTHAHTLPVELVNHASALFVQSRSFSDSLKPAEEIARPHVCAEIACRRCLLSLFFLKNKK